MEGPARDRSEKQAHATVVTSHAAHVARAHQPRVSATTHGMGGRVGKARLAVSASHHGLSDTSRKLVTRAEKESLVLWGRVGISRRGDQCDS